MSNCEICGEPVHSGTCDRYTLMSLVRDLRRQIPELQEDVRVLRGLEAARQKIDLPGVIMVRSLISHRNQKPRIDMQVGEIHTQMDADSAMDLAKNIIECCAGAYADAFIFHFVTEKLGQSSDVAVQIIVDFRDYRETLAEEFRKMQKEIPG